jgi:hypothetical protein
VVGAGRVVEVGAGQKRPATFHAGVAVYAAYYEYLAGSSVGVVRVGAACFNLDEYTLFAGLRAQDGASHALAY